MSRYDEPGCECWVTDEEIDERGCPVHDPDAPTAPDDDDYIAQPALGRVRPYGNRTT